mgnify:CR=1 FL=1
MFRTLDEEYAEIIRRVTEKTNWFMDALMDIGWYSTMMAFQIAKVPIDKIDEKISTFKDPKEFSNYIKELLGAMIQASAEASKIVELEDELRTLRAEVEYYDALLREAIAQRDRISMLLRGAIASMCEDCLRRFALAFALSQIPLVGSPVKSEKKEEGGEVSG